MFLPRFQHCVLLIALCVPSNAFEQIIGILQQNCQERVLELDADNSGVVETNELQPFVDSIGCTDSLGSDLPFDEIEVFCTQFIYRCQNASNENKETVSPTVAPTLAPTLAPTASPTAQPITSMVTLDSSTPERNEGDLHEESTSTLPPIESLPPELSSTGIGSDPLEDDDSACAFFRVRCQQWLMIGAPIAAGLLLGLCLGLVYIETRSWRHKKRRELRQEEQSSLAPVVGDEDDHVSMVPVAEDKLPPPDVEAQGVVIVRSRSRSRGPHKRQAQQQPLETLLEGDDEDASQLVSLSEVISSGTGGGDDSCGQDPTVMSDSTPLHKNTYRPTPPVDLDADDDDDDDDDDATSAASSAQQKQQPEMAVPFKTTTTVMNEPPAETRQDQSWPSTESTSSTTTLQTSSFTDTADMRQHDDDDTMPIPTDEPTVSAETTTSVSKDLGSKQQKSRTIVRDADFASESIDL